MPPRRHPADIKKIRELEQALAVAQESLHERFPDSLSALVQATRAAEMRGRGEGVADRKRVAMLERQIEEMEQRHSGSVMSLRQEHERLRLRYEDRISTLEREAQVQAETPFARRTPVATYASKSDVRRADAATDCSDLVFDGDSSTELQQRLEMVEEELLRTAKLLGEERALRGSTEKKADEALALRTELRLQQGRLEQCECALEREKSTGSENLRSERELFEKRLSENREVWAARAAQDERTIGQLQNQMAQQAAQLASCLEQLRVPQTPQMAQYQAMETQLRALEDRLKRRDAELQQAVEESRSSGRIERARLLAMHAQELREKDEQLFRFQEELQRLVAALKMQQVQLVLG